MLHNIIQVLEGIHGSDQVPFDEELIKRICISFQKNNTKVEKKDSWTDIIERHTDLIDLLISNNYLEVHNYLRHMFEMPIAHGINQGDMYRTLRDDTYARQATLHYWFNILLRLAEYVGVVPVYNPEQGNFETYINMKPNELINLVISRLDKFVLPRWQGGAFLLHTDIGSFEYHDILGLYLADKISKMYPERNISICEIGAGAGHLVYYLYQFGFRNITIIDLPTIEVGQAFFLVQNISKEKISLLGEEDNEINLRDPSCFENRTFDLVINSDSFPEIDNETVTNYINKIGDSSKIFYSINQEARAPRGALPENQTPVHEYTSKNKKFKCISRNKFWLREGYVEEIYKIEG
jgi:hypothetical protein